MYETAKETLMYRTVLWTLWERERMGRFGRMAMKHVKYHVGNELPVQVRCTILDVWASALGRPRGMVWGGRREEGLGWGTYVYLWRIHFDIWQNEYNFVKFKNKIKKKTTTKKPHKNPNVTKSLKKKKKKEPTHPFPLVSNDKHN